MPAPPPTLPPPILPVLGLVLPLLLTASAEGADAHRGLEEPQSQPSIVGVIATDGTSSLSLTFDVPMDSEDRAQISDEVLAAYGSDADDVTLTMITEDSASSTDPRVTKTGPARVTARAAAPHGSFISCGNTWVGIDTDGRMRLSYRCDQTPKRMQWDYKLSICAIVVSPVAEKGLTWWLNGARMPQNAPHVEGCSYNFHGTMNPVALRSQVDYQDVYTFKHDVGTGGTGVVAAAGSFYAHRCEECP